MSAVTIDEIDQEARTTRLVPGFSGDLEDLYRSENINEQHKILALTWLIGLFLYDSIIISDFFVAGNDFIKYFIARFLVCTPVCLLLIFFLSRKNRYYEILICLVPIVLTLTLSVLLFITRGSYRSEYLFGDLLLMICGAVISRPGLRNTAVTLLIQCGMYQTVVLMSDVVAPENRIVASMFGLCGVVVSLMTSYALEQISRRAFLLSLRVRLMNEELRTMTLTDPLTRLGNRRAFEEATQAFWSKPVEDRHQASFILIDIDRFKSFNDNYGHSAGDLCLSTIGRCIAGQMREDQDIAVRFGGEEFIVFLPDTDFNEARQIAERIRLAVLAAGVPHPVLSPDAVVSASLGVATSPTRESTPPELIIRADMALYAAKHNGRNQIWPPLGSLQGIAAWTTPPPANSDTAQVA